LGLLQCYMKGSSTTNSLWARAVALHFGVQDAGTVHDAITTLIRNMHWRSLGRLL
jgi:hypothetical protein